MPGPYIKWEQLHPELRSKIVGSLWMSRLAFLLALFAVAVVFFRFG